MSLKVLKFCFLLSIIDGKKYLVETKSKTDFFIVLFEKIYNPIQDEREVENNASSGDYSVGGSRL